MEFRDAAETVLREEGRPLHWTVVQDLALKRGYLDPFTQPDPHASAPRARRCRRGGRRREDGQGHVRAGGARRECALGQAAAVLRGRPRFFAPGLPADDFLADDFLAVDFLAGDVRVVVAAGRPTTDLRRPGRGFRAPATNSLTWVPQRSFTKLPRSTLIVTVSAAGLPHESQTRIVFSAISRVPPTLVVPSRIRNLAAIDPGRSAGTQPRRVSDGRRSVRIARVSRTDVALPRGERSPSGTASPWNR